MHNKLRAIAVASYTLAGNIQPSLFIFPSNDFVTTLGGNAVFICSINGNEMVNRIDWQINNTFIQNEANTNILFNSVLGFGQLQLSNLSAEYNSTQVRCVVELTLTSQMYTISSSASILLLQG